jgi:hypothetical protein
VKTTRYFGLKGKSCSSKLNNTANYYKYKEHDTTSFLKEIAIFIWYIPHLDFPIICADKDPTLQQQYQGVVFPHPSDLMVHKSARRKEEK